MERNQVLSIIASHQLTLKKLGVKSLELFGSVARNEANTESDVDFLVEFSTEAGLFELFKVKHYLEDILDCPVDLGTREALRENLQESILQETIRAF
jgi:predicted nucleotidyltransferase